uniref:disintegrin and metalloproteinase domain-containing protein 12-like n=1 Tax=Myxine glutinosa TaxID=7769 RepID=UPI00358FE351
ECENRCCNANNCTLRHGIECAHGACCEDCQLKPLGTGCRGSTSMCDLPEYCNGVVPVCPPNVYLLDGSPCEENSAYCYNGMCRTHEQQCNSLWGPGAKPAPDICFTRVNSAGDKYGNCGKDSVGRHMKCKPRYWTDACTQVRMQTCRDQAPFILYRTLGQHKRSCHVQLSMFVSNSAHADVIRE